MAGVIGLGGVFIDFKGDKEALHQWYEKNLSCEMSAYGSGFTSGQQLMLISFKRNEGDALINFRVDDLNTLLKRIKADGGQVLKLEETPYGDFAHILDPFDNIIELWQAEEGHYKKMVKEEIEAYKKK